MAEKKPTVNKTTKSKTAAKSSTAKKPANKTLVPGKGYIKQNFSPKALALIHKFNLQSNPAFVKLIQTYKSINDLGKKNPKFKELTKMWEDEYNFLFEGFWVDYNAKGRKLQKDAVGGWKERLDVDLTSGTSIEDKKLLFMKKITPGFVTDEERSRKRILERAGYKPNAQGKSVSFTAESKTRKLSELESIINQERYNDKTKDMDSTYIFKSNNNNKDPEDFADIEITRKPDPNLESFLSSADLSTDLSDEDNISYSSTSSTSSTSSFLDDDGFGPNDYVSNETNRFGEEGANSAKDKYAISRDEDDDVDDNVSLRQLIADDDRRINGYKSEIENKFEEETGQKRIIPTTALSAKDRVSDEEIHPDFYREEFKKIYDQQAGIEINLHSKGSFNNLNEVDLRVDPSKRNILSKEDFEFFDAKRGLVYESALSTANKDKNANKPFHELRPVGIYDMAYDPSKRPSTIKSMYFENAEKLSGDELEIKLKILRELKEQRRHRINMLKLEKSHSSIIAKAIEFRAKRERINSRKRNVENLRAIERLEKLRRLQERQRLVNLLKQRQLKLEEEKRISSQVKKERQRAIEREAQYRMNLASIEAQIHREMELIKSVELKQKAQYLKNNESEEKFDTSITFSNNYRYADLIERVEEVDSDKEVKNRDKIEQIALRFKKNL